MKKLTLISTLILTHFFSSAKTLIQAVKNNGQWSGASTWSLNRAPTNNDSIVIPTGVVVNINSNISFLSNVSIIVNGSLDFSNISILALDQASTVYIAKTGKITGTINSGEFIFIGFTSIFSGSTLTGSALFNSSGITSPLPVKFIDFTAINTENNILIQWSTAQELNASTYELQRSFDGNSWSTIAYVSAVGNTNEISKYSYTDKNVSAKVVYYCVKLVDLNGKETFTTVKVVNIAGTHTANDIKIGSSFHQVFIQFPKAIKGNVVVHFVTLSGQIINTQKLNNPVGQIIINTSAFMRGDYIVTVNNDQDIKASGKVILL